MTLRDFHTPLCNHLEEKGHTTASHTNNKTQVTIIPLGFRQNKINSMYIMKMKTQLVPFETSPRKFPLIQFVNKKTTIFGSQPQTTGNLLMETNGGSSREPSLFAQMKYRDPKNLAPAHYKNGLMHKKNQKPTSRFLAFEILEHFLYEPRYEKSGFLCMRKQRRRSALR